MNKEDIKDLDAIRRENCKLRATINRMKDEMKYVQSQHSQPLNVYTLQQQQSNATATTHNNYYINTINYNNIINNHSQMNLQNNNHKWYPLSQRAQSPSDDTPPPPPRSKEHSPGISLNKTPSMGRKLLSVDYPAGLGDVPVDFKRDESNTSTWTMKYQSSLGSNGSFKTHRSSVSGRGSCDILSIQSISLHEMEKQCVKTKRKLDERQRK